MWKLVVGLSTRGGEEQGEEHTREDEAPNNDQPEPPRQEVWDFTETEAYVTMPHHFIHT